MAVLIFCLTLLAAPSTARGDSPGATAGSASANQALGMLGSVEGIRGNAYAPLTSDAAPMTTVDGAGGRLPTAYYSQGTDTTPGLLLAGAGAEEASSQSADPNSYYSLLRSSHSLASNPASDSSCVVARVGTVSTTTQTFHQADAAATLCTDHFLYARIHRVDDNSYELQYLDTSPSGGAHGNCGGPFPGEAPIGSGGWHTLQTVTLPAAGGRTRLTGASFSMRNINGPGCMAGSAHLNAMTQGFDVSLSTGAVCPAAGAQFPAFTWGYLFEMKEDAYQEEVNDGCAALAAEPGCSLREETVDGVLTYSDFMPTFITPVTTCKTFHGSFSVFPECREWWRKERVYHCATGGSWDFSDARKRADRVAGTATDNLTTMTYQDLRKGNDGWLTEDRSTALNTPREDYTGPILACKTRRPSRKTDAALAGNAAQYLSNPDGWDFLYRKCDNGRCPADIAGGEEILIDCRVINEFAEAATVMNVLEQANKEMICSDGVKR